MLSKFLVFSSPFLAVESSFWPLLVRLSLFARMGSFVLFIAKKLTLSALLVYRCFLPLVSFLWWKDFSRESLLGFHTHKLELRLRCSMLLFILSEVFFFVSFFWAFYDAALSPVVELGMSWPPLGIVPLSIFSVPLLNTVILLSRGVTVTWAHHALVNNSFVGSFVGLSFTVGLGAYFLIMQYLEYDEAQFALSDGVYGRTFFLATGFHGMHVIVGTTFLFWVLVLLVRGFLSAHHHFSFEAAAWYWHFVDVVWLILFISIYWWGRMSV